MSVVSFIKGKQRLILSRVYIPKDEICTRLRVMNIKLAGWIFVRWVEMKTATRGTFHNAVYEFFSLVFIY